MKHVEVSPRGSALDAALLTRRRHEVLGPGAPGAPGAPGVRASRWDGDGVPDLDRGDWDLSICREFRQIIQNHKTHTPLSPSPDNFRICHVITFLNLIQPLTYTASQ